MKLAGIIAEYNPFHNGHALHIEETRKAGATHIAVAMSGSFVQRGEPACFSKFARARAAVLSGADLVVELPAPYALASARRFACAGVFLLDALGAETLSFGSECGSLPLLRRAADAVREAEESPEMAAFLKEGMSYPRARAAAAAARDGGGTARLLESPNDLLGLEYIRAASELSPAMEFFVLPRQGAGHDSPKPAGRLASATHLRGLLAREGLPAAAAYLPDSAAKLFQAEISAGRGPVSPLALERVFLRSLRELSPAEFARLPDVSEGLENRLFRAAHAASSLADFYQTVKTKRFTLSRIRRIACCAALGIPKEAQGALPGYLRVLALNSRGIEILSRAQDKCPLPIGSNFADLARLSPQGLSCDVRATDLHALAMPVVHPCGMDFTCKTELIRTEGDPPKPRE